MAGEPEPGPERLIDRDQAREQMLDALRDALDGQACDWQSLADVILDVVTDPAHADAVLTLIYERISRSRVVQ